MAVEEQRDLKEVHGKVPVPTRILGQGDTQYSTPFGMYMEPARVGPSGTRLGVLMK